MGNFSRNFCSVVRRDLVAIEELIKTYGNQRVKIHRYEHFAYHPLQATREMYEFLGLNYTQDVEQFVFSKTMAGNKAGNAYSTTRTNSTASANSWRKQLTLAAVNIIDDNCKDVYQKLGYLEIHNNETLLDFSKLVWKEVTLHGAKL